MQTCSSFQCCHLQTEGEASAVQDVETACSHTDTMEAETFKSTQYNPFAIARWGNFILNWSSFVYLVSLNGLFGCATFTVSCYSYINHLAGGGASQLAFLYIKWRICLHSHRVTQGWSAWSDPLVSRERRETEGCRVHKALLVAKEMV